jgi:hypothetical protein
MLLQIGPLGVMIQYLPFSLMTSTPLIVALSLPLPAGTKVRSVRRHGRSLVTATCPSPSPLPLPAITSPWSAENAIQHNWMGFHPSKSCEMLRSPSGRSRADTFSPSAFPSRHLRPSNPVGDLVHAAFVGREREAPDFMIAERHRPLLVVYCTPSFHSGSLLSSFKTSDTVSFLADF